MSTSRKGSRSFYYFPFMATITSFFIAGILFLSACGNGRERKQQAQEQTVQDEGTKQTEKGTSPKSSPIAQNLRNASLEGQMNTVRKSIEQGVDVNAADEAGRTALMLASYNGHTEIARLLLENGAQVDDRNAEDRTPLIFAASGPFPETVELLLNREADPNAIDGVEGWSALMFAAAGGHRQVVQTLLNHGADASLKDEDGETALDFARNNGHMEVVELLEDASQK